MEQKKEEQDMRQCSSKKGENTMNKVYTLKNGYRLMKGEMYDGYTMQTTWDIYTPDDQLYMKCGSYREAYELASHLKKMSYEDCILESTI